VLWLERRVTGVWCDSGPDGAFVAVAVCGVSVRRHTMLLPLLYCRGGVLHARREPDR
jgi:hypothetical protein